MNGVHDGSVDDGDGGGGDLAARLRGCSQLAAQQYNTIQYNTTIQLAAQHNQTNRRCSYVTLACLPPII